MKTVFKMALLAAAMGSVSGSVLANDGTITFTGKITNVSCTVKVNGGNASSTVNMPTVSASALKNKGDTAGVMPFSVSLTGCTKSGTALASGSTTQAVVYFEAGANVDMTTGMLKNTASNNPATNVALEILDGGPAGKTINIGDATQLTANTATPVSAATTTLPYAVRYHATGAATAGDVSSNVVYDVVYN